MGTNVSNNLLHNKEGGSIGAGDFHPRTGTVAGPSRRKWGARTDCHGDPHRLFLAAIFGMRAVF